MMLASVLPDVFPKFSISRVDSLCDFFIVSIPFYFLGLGQFSSIPWPVCVFVSSLRASTCVFLYCLQVVKCILLEGLYHLDEMGF